MKKPRHLNIAGVRCSVEYKPDLTDEDGTPVYGLTWGGEHQIQICSTKNDTPAKIKSTLFHEALHMALYLGGQSALLKPELEESIVTCVENALRVWAQSLDL